MEGRQEEGIAFLGSTVETGRTATSPTTTGSTKPSTTSKLGDFDALLPLYDEQIRGDGRSAGSRSSTPRLALWRLTLFGVDVRERAQVLVGDVSPS